MDSEAAEVWADKIVDALRKSSHFKTAKVQRWIDRTSPQIVLWVDVTLETGAFTLVWYDGAPITDAIKGENKRIAAAIAMGATRVESIEQKWARFQARTNELEDEVKRKDSEVTALKARVAKLEDRLGS